MGSVGHRMAEGGYEEGILEFHDVAGFDIRLADTINSGDELGPNSDITARNSCNGEINKDKNKSLIESDDVHITKVKNDEEKTKNCEHHHITEVDIERINAELNVVKEAHKKLLEEKNALIESLQSGTSMVQGVMEEAEELERKRDELQNQVKATCAQLRLETEAIQEIKESTNKDLTESENLKEQARLLNVEVERNKRLKMKKEQMIKGLYSEYSTKNIIVSNLLRQKELAAKDNGIVNVLDKAADFCELQEEIKQEALAIQNTIEDDLKLTRNQVHEMETVNSELTKTVMTKEKEIQSMTERLKEVQEKKMKQTKKLEDLQHTFDKLGERTAKERNKQSRNKKTPELDSLESKSKYLETARMNPSTDITQLKDSMKESYESHEEILCILKQQHIEIMEEFDKQLEAVKRTKPKQQKKTSERKTCQKKS